MFLKRSFDKEIMDDFSISDKRIVDALDELKLVNKYLGGIQTSKAGIRTLLNHRRNKPVKILDVGSGSSDIFENRNRFPYKLEIISLDRNKKICEVIKSSNNAHPVFGDVLSLPIAQSSVDIVHASLFLHHFNEDEITEIIKAMLSAAKSGIIINDLRRTVFALLGIKILTAFFSKSVMVKNDAPLSVKRGFVKAELINVLKKSGIRNYEIKRKWAFRWLIIIFKDGNEQTISS